MIKLTDLNATMLSQSGADNCAILAISGSGSLTQSKCYQTSKTFAACEFMDASTVADEQCRFPFRWVTLYLNAWVRLHCIDFCYQMWHSYRTKIVFNTKHYHGR